MNSMEQYDNIKTGLRRLPEPGYVSEVALPSEEEEQRELDAVQGVHGEEQGTDAEHAAFRYSRHRQQFRSQKPSTPPDDGLSNEAKGGPENGRA